MNKIDHLGIAVPDLMAATQLYQQLGFHFHGQERVESQGVTVAFFACGESHIELLEPIHDQSPISKFLAKRGPGIHHVCVEVDDIEKTLSAYRDQGIQLINPEPVPGAGGCRVAFVHPRSTCGVLLELKEKMK